MADALDSGSSGSFSCVGSSPILRSELKNTGFPILKGFRYFYAIRNSKRGQKGEYKISRATISPSPGT